MRSYGIIAIVLIALSACENREQYSAAAEMAADSFILNNISPGSRINYYPHDSDLWISYVSDSGNKVFFYSVGKQASVDSLKFDKRDMQEQYYIDKNKNTYVYKSDQYTLLVRDSIGRETNLFSRPDFIFQSWDTFARTYSATSLPMQVIDSTLILNNFQGYHLADERERGLYFGKENLSVFRIAGDSLVKKSEFAKFPDYYRDNYIDENWPVATRVGAHYVYYLYSNRNLLYKYNIQSNQTDTATIHNLDVNKIKPYDVSRITDYSYSSEYQVNTTSYLRLLHDDKSGEFAVLQMLPAKKKKDDGMMSLYEDKPMLLNLADSSLNVYKKVYFNNHVKFNLLNSCYYAGNLYIMERNSHNDHKSSIKVYVYKVK